jgi:hypothetical protein
MIAELLAQQSRGHVAQKGVAVADRQGLGGA